MPAFLFFVLIQNLSAVHPASDPFAPLTIYNGFWTVRAEHPWSGGPPGTADHLASKCQRFTQYFACEQTVNGKTLSLIVYTAAQSPDKLHTRFIQPDGLAAARGDLSLQGNHWTYFDKPPAKQTGNWSRVENFIEDRDHIRFEEYESSDAGKSWTRTNRGTEERTAN